MPSENNTPAIRFAGFTGEWEKSKFSDAFAFLQNNTLSRAELSDSGDGAKNIHYGDILVKLGECINVSIEPLPVITDKKTINKYRSSHLQNGDVVIADTAEDETVGKCSEIMGANGETIISGLHTIPCRPTESYAEGFLGHYMNSSAYHDQLIPLMQGIKVTSISKRSLQTTEVKHPKDSAEQSSLGSFFLNLDTLITLHRRKCELLETLKKSMLEKLFPKEGELVPELRFAGFTGEWEPLKLEELCVKTTGGGTPSTSMTAYWNGEIPWFQSSDFKDGVVSVSSSNKHISPAGLQKSAAHLIPANSIAIVTRVGFGKLALIPFEYTTSQDLLSLSYLGVDPLFGVYSIYKKLQSELMAVQGTSIKGITKEDLLAKDVLTSRDQDEQQKIGVFLSRIDTLLTLHRRKLELQQNIKKACLEKMFV